MKVSVGIGTLVASYSFQAEAVMLRRTTSVQSVGGSVLPEMLISGCEMASSLKIVWFPVGALLKMQ